MSGKRKHLNLWIVRGSKASALIFRTVGFLRDLVRDLEELRSKLMLNPLSLKQAIHRPT